MKYGKQQGPLHWDTVKITEADFKPQMQSLRNRLTVSKNMMGC
jgi:hypothetical protein